MNNDLECGVVATELIREFKVTNQDAWDECLDRNPDGYGAVIVRYAARWANLIEARMAEGARLEDVAKDTMHEANVEGNIGFMYAAAVSILAMCWEYGEQLRVWHNLEVHNGAEGKDAIASGETLDPILYAKDPL